MDESYVVKSMPFTMYLYNAGPSTAGTAMDIALVVVVHQGETGGTIAITDAFGTEKTLGYSDFTTVNPYPGGNHGVYDTDGVYAVLRPSSPSIDLTYDSTGNANTTSTPSSWTKFIVKSSSFSEVHFDAISSNGFCSPYNPASHDVTYYGDPSTPEPATLSVLGLVLFGITRFRRGKR